MEKLEWMGEVVAQLSVGFSALHCVAFVLFRFDDYIAIVYGLSRYGFRPCYFDTVCLWKGKMATFPMNLQSYFTCVKEGGLELFWRQHMDIWESISWAGVQCKDVLSLPSLTVKAGRETS